MKILQINKYFYHKGGAETVFFNTMALLEQNGHDIIPFCLKNTNNSPSKYESYFVDFPELSASPIHTKLKNITRFVYNKSAASQLDKLIRDQKPDIAHIHLLFNSHSVAILPILKRHKIPIVMTVHDYRLICPAYDLKDGHENVCEKCLISKKYWQCITNKCSKGNLANSVLLAADSYFRKYFMPPIDLIDHFIFVSNFSRNKHLEAEPRFREKSSQLYNFTLVNKDLELKKEDYILYFGRISEEKGITTLVNTMKDLPFLHLKVAGDGPLLESLVREKSDNIEFLGFKSGSELNAYIQKARYVIVPSECYENNPMTIIEAMTLGTPVIGSRIGGIPELIKDRETGFLFESKSAENLKSVILDAIKVSDEGYKLLSQSAQKFAIENFSTKSHLDKLLGIYNQLIEENTL